MKPSPFFLLTLCVASTAAVAAPAPKVLLAQTEHSTQIAQVKSGTLKTANASWWGFDKTDATACLQSAINSGVPKLIVDNTGSDWIIGKPLILTSNQEIVFADGVVVQAKEDAFHGRNDSLITGKNLTNLTLRGEGTAILRMRKKDYQDPSRYSRAEWRMGISLVDCSDVVIRNLTVTETGGDGLYLGASSSGYCKNVLVEDMNFDANHRLGMAVISAENLTVRRCKFNNTLGTGPNGGIDFEPNYPGQRLVNCVVEDSEFNHNIKGSGIDIYAVNLDGNSLPMSITFNRCKIAGNSVGLASTIVTKNVSNPVRGTVTMNDCHFDHNRIRLRNPITKSVQYFFKNCTVDYSPADGKSKWDNVPLELTTDTTIGPIELGGIAFDHSTVILGENTQPIAALLQGQASFSDQFTGTLFAIRNGKTSPVDLAAFVRGQREYWSQINSLKPAKVDLASLQIPAQDAPRQGNNTFYLQGAFTFLQYAKNGQQITVNLRVSKVYDRTTEVELQDPSGKTLQKYTLPLDGKPVPITFTAEQTGLYRIVRQSTFSQKIDVTSSHKGNGLLAEKTLRFLSAKGRIYFQVPAGVKSFTISVSTDSSADVALLDASGKEVTRQEGVHGLELLSGTRTDASKSEFWSLNVSDAVWLVNVTLYDPLIPILSTNPDTMLIAE